MSLYLYVDDEFDENEWMVSGITASHNSDLWSFGKIGGFKKIFSKHSSFNRISDNIIEINLDNNVYKPATEQQVESAKSQFAGLYVSSSLAISYSPNKKHKKAGKKEMYWFVNMSKYDYDEDLVSWNTNQVELSINEIIATKNTSRQLFASIVQPEVIPQNLIANQNNVQYVIVQNQPQQVIQQQPTPIISEENEIPDSDIDIDIPYAIDKNKNAFALVIANEEYSKVASVPFAKRDGQKVRDYLTKTLGFEKEHVTLLENATLNDMKYELKRLSNISEAYGGDISVCVYYSGHGIPDEKTGDGYLLPVDGYGNDVTTAFSIKELYSFLGNLKSNKTLLFMDACFSGASKTGDMLVSARGISIKTNEVEPQGNFIVFSACQGDETAYPYKEKGHGLMTYYLLKKIKETKGKVLVGDLGEYITDNVGKTAIVINGKSQTPTVSVSPELQEIWREQTLFD